MYTASEQKQTPASGAQTASLDCLSLIVDSIPQDQEGASPNDNLS